MYSLTKNVSYPSRFRSTTATSYPKEDAGPDPWRMCSTKSLPESLFSRFSRTTAPLWLALGAPATTVRSRLLVMRCPESRENPKVGEKIQKKTFCFVLGHKFYLFGRSLTFMSSCCLEKLFKWFAEAEKKKSKLLFSPLRLWHFCFL